MTIFSGRLAQHEPLSQPSWQEPIKGVKLPYMLETFEHEYFLELRLCKKPVNALDSALMQALIEAISQAQDGDKQAIVLTGAPGMFSAGLDVPHLLTLSRDGMRQLWECFFLLTETIAKSSLPVVAAITGHSPAGGAVLALYCDHRIMAEGDFRIGLNEVQVGLPLPPPIYTALRYVVGARQAERLAVRGLLISGEEALRIGLVDEIHPPDKVLSAATDWCRGWSQCPPVARSKTRDLVRSELVDSFAAIDDMMLDSFVEAWFSDETQATMRAMVERLKK